MKTENLVLDELRNLQRQIEKELDKVKAAIAAVEAQSPLVATPKSPASLLETSSIPYLKVKGMTQLQAIIALAKYNGGTVKAQDAKKLLLSSGLMKKTKNSTNIVHSTIIRSEKFERIGAGEYRLKPTGFFPAGTELETMSESKPVQ